MAAKKVHVVAVENHAERLDRYVELPTDIAAHLCRHGVAVEAENDTAGDISIGELILGGVSRTLLEQTAVPLLMSH